MPSIAPVADDQGVWHMTGPVVIGQRRQPRRVSARGMPAGREHEHDPSEQARVLGQSTDDGSRSPGETDRVSCTMAHGDRPGPARIPVGLPTQMPACSEMVGVPVNEADLGSTDLVGTADPLIKAVAVTARSKQRDRLANPTLENPHCSDATRA